MARSRRDLFARLDGRSPEPRQCAPSGRDVVSVKQCTGEVDLDVRDYEVRARALTEARIEPLVSGLLEIREVDLGIDVICRADVSPPNFDVLLVQGCCGSSVQDPERRRRTDSDSLPRADRWSRRCNLLTL